MAKDFDSLMAEMGVKPMNQSKEQVAKPRTTKRVPNKASRLPPAGQGASERVVALERALAVAKEERAQAKTEITSLQKKLRTAQKKLAALEAEAQIPRPSVAETLHAWGFETPAERARLLRQNALLERIISNPCLEHDQALMMEIGHTVARVCTDCEPPAQMTAIHVPVQKCMVCGGRNMDTASRKFTDSALLNGRLRIVIVGRTTMHHRLLRRFIGTDKRMVVTQLPGDIRRDAASAQTDVDHADAVIIWDPDSIDPDLLNVYARAANGGVVPPGPVGELLEQAVGFIGGD